MNNLGGKIKAARLEERFTQEELADKMRAAGDAWTNRVTISKWENGVHEPAVSTLAILAKVLGRQASEFIGDAKPPHNRESDPEYDALTPDEKDLLEDFRKISLADQAFLLRFARMAVKNIE